MNKKRDEPADERNATNTPKIIFEGIINGETGCEETGVNISDCNQNKVDQRRENSIKNIDWQLRRSTRVRK